MFSKSCRTTDHFHYKNVSFITLALRKQYFVQLMHMSFIISLSNSNYECSKIKIIVLFTGFCVDFFNPFSYFICFAWGEGNMQTILLLLIQLAASCLATLYGPGLPNPHLIGFNIIYAILWGITYFPLIQCNKPVAIVHMSSVLSFYQFRARAAFI